MVKLNKDLFINCATVSVYSPDNVLIGQTKNPLVLDDFRRQIKAKGLKGYYFEWNGNRSILNKDGNTTKYPDCYDKMTEIWMDLIGL